MGIIIKALNKILEAMVISLLAVIAITVFFQIIFRYGLNTPLSWSEELAKLCFLWAVFLGLPLVTYSNMHIRVDYIVDLLPRRLRNVFCLGIDIILVLFYVSVFFYGLQFIHSQQGMRSVALNIPMVYFSWSVPIGMLLETIYGLYNISIGTYKNTSDDSIIIE